MSGSLSVAVHWERSCGALLLERLTEALPSKKSRMPAAIEPRQAAACEFVIFGIGRAGFVRLIQADKKLLFHGCVACSPASLRLAEGPNGDAVFCHYLKCNPIGSKAGK